MLNTVIPENGRSRACEQFAALLPVPSQRASSRKSKSAQLSGPLTAMVVWHGHVTTIHLSVSGRCEGKQPDSLPTPAFAMFVGDRLHVQGYSG